VELSKNKYITLKKLLKKRKKDWKEMERLCEKVKALKKKASRLWKTKLLGKNILKATQNLMEILNKRVSYKLIKVFFIQEGGVA
jgi:hypothetical protein